MPHIRIETLAGWAGARRAEVMDAVQRALVEALRLPAGERHMLLQEHDPACWALPSTHGPRYTRIEIAMFPGRSTDAKRRLYQALVRALEGVGVPAGDVEVVLLEIARENWGLRGGQAACDIDFAKQG